MSTELSEEENKALWYFSEVLTYEEDEEQWKVIVNLIAKQQEKIEELEKGNRSLMESRIKWKNRYYKEKAKNKKLLEGD